MKPRGRRSLDGSLMPPRPDTRPRSSSSSEKRPLPSKPIQGLPIITYELIKDLASTQLVEGNRLKVVFKSENASLIAQSSGILRKEPKAFLVPEHHFRLLAASLFGEDTEGSSKDFTEDERRHALIEAFVLIQHNFVWNGKRFLAPDIPKYKIPFYVQLDKYPIVEKYDLGITARIMTEIALSDGNVTHEEAQFLRLFTSSKIGQLGDLAHRKPTEEELAIVSPGPVRQTIIMLAWAVALVDEKLQESENQSVKNFAKRFGLIKEECYMMKDFAIMYVLDRCFECRGLKGEITNEDLRDIQVLCDKFKAPKGALDDAQIRYQDRIVIA